MICESCKRVFALDPKKAPYISDLAFKKLENRLSTFGKNYFTYNQLYAQLYRLIRKKRRRLVYIAVFFAAAVSLILSVPALGDIGFLTRLFAAGLVAGVVGLIARSWSVKIKESSIRSIIQQYDSVHGINNLVKGDQFKEIEPGEFDKEILKYAPERMLIVERDDIADMLLLNDFAMEQRTLVVSASRYPKRAFQIFRHFAKKKPNIPISVTHDASREGLRLKDKLQNDPAWGLENREIKDLGLFPEDLKQLKEPVWRPEPQRGSFTERSTPRSSDPMVNISKGFRAPVDTAPPGSFMSAAAMAMIVGAPILSPEFLERRAADAGAGGIGDGGFG
jgi:hypothetical protein